MHVITRTGLRRLGGAALAVVAAASLTGLTGPASAAEAAPVTPAPTATDGPVTPAPTATDGPATTASPIPTGTPDPTGTPTPSGTATPAPSSPVAAPAAGDADVGVSLRGTAVSVGAVAKFLQVIATNNGSETARDVVFDITVTPTSGPDRIELDATADDLGCAATGAASIRCEPGDIPPGADVTIGIPYRAAEGAGPNADAGTVTATVSSASPDTDATNDTVNGTLAIVPAASDLLVIADDIVDAVPGRVVPFAVVVVNFGSRTSGPAQLTVVMPARTTLVGGAAGCTTASNRRSLTCVYDSLTGPGGSGQDSDFLELRVKVDRALVGPRTLTGGTAVIADPAGSARLAAAGPVRTAALRNPVGATRLAALAGDADDSDNDDTFAATVAPVADLSVTLGAVRVSGTTATVPYTVHSAGPAVATGVLAKITAPTGTRFAGVPARCTGDGRTLRCALAGSLAPGRSVSGSVRFAITGTVGRDGTIVAGSAAFDPARANNRADIDLAGALDGQLAVTGARSAPLAGSGAALLLLGGTLVLLASRRRGAAAAVAVRPGPRA
jgi:hypothetical protein